MKITEHPSMCSTPVLRPPVLGLMAGIVLWMARGETAGAGNESKPLKPLPPGVEAIHPTGIHNAFRLGTDLYSGSAPEGEPAFAELARLGVKTIISVDGGRPRVELARKHGMRYVHLPHGYDGIGSNVQVRLVKAAQTSGGAIFVHCHHGLHRGPAAVALICVANQGWTSAQGEAWLKAAGTGSNYVGLYETVRNFKPPSAEQLRAIPGELFEVAKVTGLVEAMVAIDESWGHLKQARKAGYSKLAKDPDIQPEHQALLLWEHFREAQRLEESAALGQEFLKQMRTSETLAKTCEVLLRRVGKEESSRSLLQPELDRQFDALGQSCVSCHKAYRDRK